MAAPQNRFQFTFKPGEHIPEAAFDRFESFLPRFPNEPDVNYARRLQEAGLAILVKSEDMRDFASYKATIAQAEDAGLPLAMLTNPVPDHVQERMQERQQKPAQQYLDEARAQAQGL